MVRVSRRFIVPLLSVMLIGVAPAPVSAATTISGAVVVIPIARWPKSVGYRLTANRATYLATFGAGNSDALVTTRGGCAIKSGQLSCYGVAGTVGDGSSRNRPLSVPVTLPGGDQAISIWDTSVSPGWWYDDNGNFDYRAAQMWCAQGISGAYCWGNNAGTSIPSPVTVFSGGLRKFTGEIAQTESGQIYHWEPANFSVSTSSYVMRKLADSLEGIAPSDVELLTTSELGTYSYMNSNRIEVRGPWGVCVATAGELRCLNVPLKSAMYPEIAELWPDSAAAPLTSATSFSGTPIDSHQGTFCAFNELVVSCTTSSNAYDSDYISGDFTPDANLGEYSGGTLAFRHTQMQPQITLPAGSSSPIVTSIDEDELTVACAIHDTHGLVCQDKESVLDDVDEDGAISIGREFGLECGVGFSCEFTPTKLRQSDGIITAVGTLVRTPRTSATISGTARFSDGIPFQGSVEWNSSDGKLRATSAVAADGSFTLAARSGMGSIKLQQAWDELPATCLDGTVTAGCVTESETTIYLDELASSSNVNITVPSYAGEMRTIDLRFGDGETPIADVALNAVDPDVQCITTTVSLGRMVSCARQGRGLNGDYGSQIKTGANGIVSLWMPTAMDSVLRATAADEYGLTWTDDIVSLGDDGATPEPYSFAGLIFAQPLGAMSVRQGSTGTISALVSVDGIDPAYGLSAGIRPTSTVAATCLTERRTDATDESGLVDFSLCPAGTQLWKVYATDGSFFPSAPFPITIDPAITGLRVNGATLDAAFSGGTTNYTGRFTSSRVTFTPTRASWAGSARVTTPTCSRPSSGTRNCTMSVRIGSSTITYTFTLRR